MPGLEAEFTRKQLCAFHGDHAIAFLPFRHGIRLPLRCKRSFSFWPHFIDCWQISVVSRQLLSQLEQVAKFQIRNDVDFIPGFVREGSYKQFLAIATRWNSCATFPVLLGRKYDVPTEYVEIIPKQCKLSKLDKDSDAPKVRLTVMEREHEDFNFSIEMLQEFGILRCGGGLVVSQEVFDLLRPHLILPYFYIDAYSHKDNSPLWSALPGWKT